MNEKIINSTELKSFVETHDLMNRYSIVQFHSIVSLTTEKSKISNKEVVIMVSFDGYDSYGKVTILDGDIDPNLFPTEFEAKWQKMIHVNQESLMISGFHKSNSAIGKYNVSIIPLKRTRD